MSKWSDVKIYDLSIPIGVNCPPWPTYEPVQMKFFKRLSSNGANGQLLTHSNHVGTHLDGPLHFDTSGRTVDQLELTKLVRPGVVVDLTDAPCCEDFGIYTPEMIEERVEVREGGVEACEPAEKAEEAAETPAEETVEAPAEAPAEEAKSEETAE